MKGRYVGSYWISSFSYIRCILWHHTQPLWRSSEKNLWKNIPPASTHNVQAAAYYEPSKIQSTLMAWSILDVRLLNSVIMHCIFAYTLYVSGDRWKTRRHDVNDVTEIIMAIMITQCCWVHMSTISEMLLVFNEDCGSPSKIGDKLLLCLGVHMTTSFTFSPKLRFLGFFIIMSLKWTTSHPQKSM